MGFADDLSAWPMSLEIDCQDPETPDGPGLLTIFDARPFGRGNLKVAESGPPPSRKAGSSANVGDSAEELRTLERCLEQAEWRLESGPYFEPFNWRLLEPGLWRAETEAFYGPRLGPRGLVLVRADPRHFRLAPYHESEEDRWRDSPGDIKAWAKRLPEAPLLINAGQYYPDRRYMGTLRRMGKDLGGPAHQIFKGFWAQDPSPGAAAAVLIDLETALPGDAGPEAYGTIIQSYMVLDRLGRVRVKRTERLASRVILGVDREGRAVLVMVRGAITMSDLALLGQKLGLVSALGLDGGLETQLAFNGPNGLEIQFGRYAANFLGNFQAGDLSRTLPAVIVFERLQAPGPEGGLEPPGGGD
jgi:hypothetical protein